MSNFTMLTGQTVYVQREEIGNPYWKNGIYYEGEKIITYEPIAQCFVEEMEPEASDYLPSGVTLRDSRWLFTDANLETYREQNDSASMCDTIYLGNPETGKKKTAYKVFDKMSWEEDGGMELLDTDSYDYVIIKEGKL